MLQYEICMKNYNRKDKYLQKEAIFTSEDFYRLTAKPQGADLEKFRKIYTRL